MAKTTKLMNKAGEVVGTVAFDEGTRSWHLISDAEPNFRRTFPREQAAFYFWYSRFDPQGKCATVSFSPCSLLETSWS